MLNNKTGALLAAAALIGVPLAVQQCNKSVVRAQGDEIDSLMRNARIEQVSTNDWNTARFPAADRALVIQTKNYVINFLADAKEDRNGILFVFDKRSNGKYEIMYAKMDSGGNVLSGSASVARFGLRELREENPRIFDSIPMSLEANQSR